jgi:hypothetical protein
MTATKEKTPTAPMGTGSTTTEEKLDRLVDVVQRLIPPPRDWSAPTMTDVQQAAHDRPLNREAYVAIIEPTTRTGGIMQLAESKNPEIGWRGVKLSIPPWWPAGVATAEVMHPTQVERARREIFSAASSKEREALLAMRENVFDDAAHDVPRDTVAQTLRSYVNKERLALYALRVELMRLIGLPFAELKRRCPICIEIGPEDLGPPRAWLDALRPDAAATPDAPVAQLAPMYAIDPARETGGTIPEAPSTSAVFAPPSGLTRDEREKMGDAPTRLVPTIG